MSDPDHGGLGRHAQLTAKAKPRWGNGVLAVAVLLTVGWVSTLALQAPAQGATTAWQVTKPKVPVTAFGVLGLSPSSGEPAKYFLALGVGKTGALAVKWVKPKSVVAFRSSPKPTKWVHGNPVWKWKKICRCAFPHITMLITYRKGLKTATNVSSKFIFRMRGYSDWVGHWYLQIYNPPWWLDVLKGGNGSGTVTSQPKGIACGATCSDYNFFPGNADGKHVTLTATPASGSTFIGWIGTSWDDVSGTGRTGELNCPGTGACVIKTKIGASAVVFPTFMHDGDPGGNVAIVVYGADRGSPYNGRVKFTPQPDISSGGGPGGYFAEYSPNQSVTLDASVTQSDRWEKFIGWSGACTGTGVCTLDLTPDMAGQTLVVLANFFPK